MSLKMEQRTAERIIFAVDFLPENGGNAVGHPFCGRIRSGIVGTEFRIIINGNRRKGNPLFSRKHKKISNHDYHIFTKKTFRSTFSAGISASVAGKDFPGIIVSSC